MNSRYRIYAAVGLAGVITLVGGFLMLGRGETVSNAPAPAIKPLHPVAKKVRDRAAQKHPAQKRNFVPTAVRKTRVTDGMPAAVSAALAKSTVVVVSLVAPGAAVDDLAYEEAKAGARQAGAGFVRISVAHNDDVQALTTLVNSSASPDDRLLDAPAVLIFRQPQQLFVRFNGFVDADTVAQAATNASPVVQVQPGKSSLADPWVVAANNVCTQLRTQLASTALPTSFDQLLPYLEELVADTEVAINRIRTLKAPRGKAARVAAMLAAYDRTLADVKAELVAIRKRDSATARRLASRVQAESRTGDRIAAELGANACAADNA